MKYPDPRIRDIAAAIMISRRDATIHTNSIRTSGSGFGLVGRIQKSMLVQNNLLQLEHPNDVSYSGRIVPIDPVPSLSLLYPIQVLPVLICHS